MATTPLSQRSSGELSSAPTLSSLATEFRDVTLSQGSLTPKAARDLAKTPIVMDPEGHYVFVSSQQITMKGVSGGVCLSRATEKGVVPMAAACRHVPYMGRLHLKLQPVRHLLKTRGLLNRNLTINSACAMFFPVVTPHYLFKTCKTCS